jgi:hypothetical protein
MFTEKMKSGNKMTYQIIVVNKIIKLRQRHGFQRRRLVAIIARHSQETLVMPALEQKQRNSLSSHIAVRSCDCD